jgi:hypothetical protein
MNFKKILVGAAASAILLGATIVPALADTSSVNFEPLTYTIGNINGQDGWSKTGAFDVAVVSNTYGYGTFGTQSLRTSDAITSGSFGDQTFAKPLTDAVGEVDSTNGTFSPGTLQRHFEMQFDIASTVPGAQQPGMHTSVSPDRGDGSRMSYLRFEDGTAGLDVFFDDVQGTVPFGVDGCTTIVCGNFVETQVGTSLSRTVPHTVKLTMDLLDGFGNDVVKVWIDGTLVHTGTSWEDYYRFDPESIAEQSPRIVKTVLFRESGTANPADAENGFLIDNLSTLSGPIPATAKALGSVTGGLTLTSPRQQISFNAFDYGTNSLNDRGTVEYQNFDYPGGLHYTANVTCATVSGNDARFMFQIPSGFPGLSGLYVVVSVHDGGSPGTKADTYGHTATADLTTAKSLCEYGVGVTNYKITGGNLVVH